LLQRGFTQIAAVEGHIIREGEGVLYI
jgi:hypothetical protein